uniref:Uncharacterized protein n=1 Tax=Arundo donax TaxID=35708 RepID=A0A0A9BIB4_ARUDO
MGRYYPQSPWIVRHKELIYSPIPSNWVQLPVHPNGS